MYLGTILCGSKYTLYLHIYVNIDQFRSQCYASLPCSYLLALSKSYCLLPSFLPYTLSQVTRHHSWDRTTPATNSRVGCYWWKAFQQGAQGCLQIRWHILILDTSIYRTITYVCADMINIMSSYWNVNSQHINTWMREALGSDQVTFLTSQIPHIINIPLYTLDRHL